MKEYHGSNTSTCFDPPVKTKNPHLRDHKPYVVVSSFKISKFCGVLTSPPGGRQSTLRRLHTYTRRGVGEGATDRTLRGMNRTTPTGGLKEGEVLLEGEKPGRQTIVSSSRHPSSDSSTGPYCLRTDLLVTGR